VLRDERLNREEEEKKRKRVDEVSCLSLALPRVCGRAFPECTLSLASAAVPDIFVLARPRARAERSSCARKREKVLKCRL
jgi:hypothetical protein